MLVLRLAMASGAHWCDRVLTGALEFEVEGQGRKWRSRSTWKGLVEEESLMVCTSREDALCPINVGCWH